MRLNKAMLVAAAALAACGTAQAQTKWDMPTPYSDGEFHTRNVKHVRRGREEGNRRQARHQRALQRLAHQASGHAARGVDRPGEHRRIPARPVRQRGPGVRRRQRAVRRRRATTTRWKFYQAQKPVLEKKLQGRGLQLLYSVAWPGQGIYTKDPLKSVDDLKGTEVPHLQPAHRAARRAARREPDGDPGARDAADVRHRRDARDDHLVRHRHLDQGLGVRQELLQDQRLAPEERGGGERARLRAPAEGAAGRRWSRPPPPPRRAAGRCRRRARRKATRLLAKNGMTRAASPTPS